MLNRSPIVSVVVPVYNVEEYLLQCVDSLLDQAISLEIILVDDGSTDSSGAIADAYAQGDSRIRVIHQENRGTSGARNSGLKVSRGKYVVFIDSDDVIERGSLETLSRLAEQNSADVVWGRIIYFSEDGYTYSPFSQIAKEHEGECFDGKEWFSIIIGAGLFGAPICGNMFRREWLTGQSLYFKETLHENELWIPTALGKAGRVLVTDCPFYYYRQREGSIMHTLPPGRRLDTLVAIANELAGYADSYSFENDGTFKSRLWVDILNLYDAAFRILPGLKDSSYVPPGHRLETLPGISRRMDESARADARSYYLSAKQSLERHRLWLDAPSTKRVYDPHGQRLILLFNVPDRIAVPYDSAPERLFVTDDRKYQRIADEVVFYMPDLFDSLDSDLDKPYGQMWIAWFDSEDERLDFLQNENLDGLFDDTLVTEEDESVLAELIRE